MRNITTTYGYNNAGDLSGVSYSDSTAPLSYRFDRQGRQTSVTQGGATTTRAYDVAGDPLSESYSGGPLDTLAVTNGYDQYLRRTALGVQQSNNPLIHQSFGYDAASRLLWAADGNGNSAGYTYVANSPLVSQIGFTNGTTLRMVTSKQYDYLNRLSSITNTPSAAGAPVIGFAYQNNTANQRTALTNADGSYWAYQYDSLGQVISGKKYWPDGTAVAGQQFEYTFDDIGNRKTAGTDGDQNGNNLRYQDYTANDLNQYTSRTVPGYVQSLGTAATNARVVLWGDSSHYTVDYRRGSYFWGELWYDNSGGPLWVNLTNFAAVAGGTNADVVASTSGHIFLPNSTEQFTYDADGNLTADSRWNYTWDAENRLITMVARTSVGPQISLAFDYDAQGRRIRKRVWSNTNWSGNPTNDLRFVYDGWNLAAELDGLRTPNSAIRTYLWGLDLSGSPQGAGGVGGLLEVSGTSNSGTTNCFVAFDGNGNVMGLANAGDATVVAQYEYGPFGEVIRTTGPVARAIPFRFSTKYQNDETDQVYYGCRYYVVSSGRWLSRDPLVDEGLSSDIPEVAGEPRVARPEAAPTLFAGNCPSDFFDPVGLWPSSDHFLYVIPEPTPLTHQNAIVRGIPGLSANDYAILKSASVFVDSFQGTALSYMHAMSDPDHSPAAARVLANEFVSEQIAKARLLLCSCPSRRDAALFQFGEALHTIQDATSPAHTGFQIWRGVKGHKAEAVKHVLKENWDPGWFITNSRLDTATAWLWTFFACPQNAPSFPPDWFSGLGYDSSPGY